MATGTATPAATPTAAAPTAGHGRRGRSPDAGGGGVRARRGVGGHAYASAICAGCRVRASHATADGARNSHGGGGYGTETINRVRYVALKVVAGTYAFSSSWTRGAVEAHALA